MGCASSKQTRCKHCNCTTTAAPLSRSSSVPIHHQSQHKGDSNHFVALTSCTLGTLQLNSCDETISSEQKDEDSSKEFSMQLSQAMSWSNMINEKIPMVIPRTPCKTPPGEPENINSWELMEGLDDASPLRLPNGFDRSFSCHVVGNPTHLDRPVPKLQESGNGLHTLDLPESKLQESGNGLHTLDQQESTVEEKGIAAGTLGQPSLKLEEEDGIGSPTSTLDQPKSEKLELRLSVELANGDNGSCKPEWMLTEETNLDLKSDTVESDFDPEIILTFRKALEEISPVKMVYIRSPENEKAGLPSDNHLQSKRYMEPKKVINVIIHSKCPPQGEDKVVIYFTSLRGVRKTYEDCCNVRVMLKGLGVRIDERDVSMHYGFREELKELLGGSGFGSGLPKVFVKGQYIGGAEEIKQLNEDGELGNLVEGCVVLEDHDGLRVCELCGDVRFVPCESCSGSCKIYCEDENDWDGEDVAGGGFQRCPGCNENGLVRCPVCCN